MSDPDLPTRPSPRVALLALTVSFCAISAVGGLLLYWGWRSYSLSMAVGRCAVFVVFMAGVHVIGYRLWRGQFVPDQGERNGPPSGPIAPAYKPAVKSALIQQGIVFILAGLILDGGLTFNAAVIAVVAYWLAFGLLIFRRANLPTRGDILWVRYGFLLILLIVLSVGPYVLEALGR